MVKKFIFLVGYMLSPYPSIYLAQQHNTFRESEETDYGQ